MRRQDLSLGTKMKERLLEAKGREIQDEKDAWSPTSTMSKKLEPGNKVEKRKKARVWGWY